MDIEQNSSPYGPPPVQGQADSSAAEKSAPPPLPPGPPAGQFRAPLQPGKKGGGWKIFWGVILALSIMANVAMFAMLIGVIAIFATGQKGRTLTQVVRDGSAWAPRIAMITVDGIIYGEAAQEVHRQFEAARADGKVRGIILRVNSPGGTISASDQIHREIMRYRKEEGKPIVAFMQGIAASGGYYVSVPCDKIIAEPTTITGSIGVISSYFVVQELLKDKLGVLPVTVKSGVRKDWPSMFQAPSEEQIQYMQEKLIQPAYARFLEVVADGRKDVLTIEQIKPLADGAIFGAEEAVKEKLIDDVGYLEDAIELVKKMAGISDARVVRYRKPFSLMDMLSYRTENPLTLKRETLYDLGTPETMYLWSGY